MGRIAVLTLCTFCSLIASGAENKQLQAFDGNTVIELNSVQSEYIYGKILAHLSTCAIGNPPNRSEAKKDFIAALVHPKGLQLNFPLGAVSIPIGDRLVDIDDVFITLQAVFAPAAVSTRSGGTVQHYAKCSGHSALYSFTCDPIISSLLHDNWAKECDPIIQSYRDQLLPKTTR
jgi:hypothetical protein